MLRAIHLARICHTGQKATEKHSLGRRQGQGGFQQKRPGPPSVVCRSGRQIRSIDTRCNLVQCGADRYWNLTKSKNQKRFTVSVDADDYASLSALADGHKPPLTLRYVVNVAIKNLLKQHSASQLTFPLDELQR